VREHFLEVRGLEHHVVEHPGGAGGRTIFLLHGYLDHARLFDKLAAELPEHRLLAPDFRGHGATGHVGAGGYYHFPDYVADVHALIGRLAETPVAVVGHSMGGGVATYLTGAFPELVSHLALIESLGPPTMRFTDGPDRMRGFVEDLERTPRRAPRRFASLAEAAARVRERNPSIAEADALHYARFATRADGEGLVWRFDPLHQTRAPTLFLEEIFEPFLRRIACPVLVVEGERGFLLDEATRARRLGMLARAEAVRVAGASHHVHLDAPREVADAIRRLLARGSVR
jgi:pimeloyl-ACP methyl ester carboxylesterase